MSALRSRRLIAKRQQAAALRTPPLRPHWRATVAPLPVALEWCADHHDKNTPQEKPALFPAPSFIRERPYLTTFVLIQAGAIMAVLASASSQRWLAAHPGSVMTGLTVLACAWLSVACGTLTGDILFYRIDLEAQQLVLHRPGAAGGIRIMRLSFDSITSIGVFKTCSSDVIAGIDIRYLDDRLKLKKVQVPAFVPEPLAEAHMEMLRPALGLKVEESVTHDN